MPPCCTKRNYLVDLYSVARSRAQIYSSVRPRFIPEGDEGRSVHGSTDNISLQKTLAESQLGPGHGARRIEFPSSSLYTGSSLANVESGSRHVSANSLCSGSRPSSRSTVTNSSRRSVMSEDGFSVRAFTRLGLREHRWGQNEPAAPFLHSGEPFANAKYGGRLVPLNPLLSRGRSPSCKTIPLGEDHSVRMASPAPSENTGVRHYCQTIVNGLSLILDQD